MKKHHAHHHLTHKEEVEGGKHSHSKKMDHHKHEAMKAHKEMGMHIKELHKHAKSHHHKAK